MTHSHDTSTPAMSAETVPSEEFVLVPREPTHEMKEAGARENQGMYPIAIYRAMIAAAPTLSAAAPTDNTALVERCLNWMEQYSWVWQAGRGEHPQGLVEDLRAALSTPTEGPASQTEGMGGDALRDVRLDSEKAEEWPAAQKALWRVVTGENLNDGHYINAYRLTEKLYAAIAALTPPETAEAVPDDLTAAYMAGVERGREEVARLREELERESEESYEIGKRDGYGEAVQHIDQRTGGDGEYCCVVGYDADDRHCPDPQTMIVRIVGRFESLAGQTNSANQERDDAVKALESVTEELGLFRDFVINNATVWTIGSNHHHPIWARVAERLKGYTSPRDGEKWSLVRAATASDPAPATDDRERLVEENKRLRDALVMISLTDWYTRRVRQHPDGGLRGMAGMLATRTLTGENPSYLSNEVIIERFGDPRASREIQPATDGGDNG